MHKKNIFKASFPLWSLKKNQNEIFNMSATGGGEWGGIPCPFLKIENIGLILEKKALIVSICGLSFPFKM